MKSLRSNRDLVFYYAIATAIFAGGFVLLLLTVGVLNIHDTDPLNFILSSEEEYAIYLALSVALLAAPLWLTPYIRGILRRKQAIKVGVNHHVRNRAQVILLNLDILEAEAKTTEQREMVESARKSCYAMLESLSNVVDSDGDKIDYSLAMKEYVKASS